MQVMQPVMQKLIVAIIDVWIIEYFVTWEIFRILYLQSDIYKICELFIDYRYNIACIISNLRNQKYELGNKKKYKIDILANNW